MNEVVSQITSTDLQQKLLFLKIIFLSLSSVLIGYIIYFIRHSNWWEFFFPRYSVQAFLFKGFEKRRMVRTWERTKKRLETKIASEYKLAVIEADSFLNDILGRMGYSGESLGERLKKVPDNVLPNLENVWGAHKIRNNIVHDPGYRLTQKKAKEVIGIYEKTFKNLEIF